MDGVTGLGSVTKEIPGVDGQDMAEGQFSGVYALQNPWDHERDAPWGTWVAQQLSLCLWLRSLSQDPGIESRIGLLAGSLLLPLPVSLPLSLFVMNKYIFF